MDQNTQQWANAEKHHRGKATQEIAQLSTNGMSISQKSDLLHSIANSAEAEVQEEQHPGQNTKPLTEEQIEEQRSETADEVEKQTLELEDETFSAKDLNAFTAMTS